VESRIDVKFVVAGVGVLIVSSLAIVALATPAGAAPPGAPATATAHALDELANCRAQHRPECRTDVVTPTPRPASTSTSTPLATATLIPTPTTTPEPQTADTPASDDPPLPMPQPGEAIAAYVRPTPRDATGTWLELALPQGRWAVLYDTSQCTAPLAWTNVWLALDDQSERLMTADRDDNGMCALVQWSWSSDAPCGADDRGACDVNMDEAYWSSSTQTAPAATSSPVPTSAPTTVPIAPAPRIAYVAQPTAPVPTPRVVYVEVTRPPLIQNVLVVTATPAPLSTPTLETVAPTPTEEPSDPLVPITAEATEVQAVPDMPTVSHAAEALAGADPAPAASQPTDWSPAVVVAGVALVIGAFVVLIGKRSGRPW
jgi:hypothetical protein